MLHTLQHALRHHPTEDFELRFDSMLAAGLAQGTLQATSNLELVASLRFLVVQFERHASIQFTHVRAHTGEWWNERVDSLAKRGALMA
jgi:ribonuclease HI